LLHNSAGGTQAQRGKENHMPRQGDVVVLHTSGGGGFGPVG
jgi:N-methylhydantoinase B/oxoprolinase/acetone carboxylase alpha subunit